MGADAVVFPASGEAEWRKAAEAALKGKSLESLSSRTADEIAIAPLYPPADGPRPLGPSGPWRVMARLDHPDAGEANAQALDDLAGGADGLTVVFEGAIGAHGFGLRKFDPATLHAAFEGVRFDAGAHFELDLGTNGPREALSFAALIERSGARPPDCAVSFGLDPFAAAAAGPFPADWSSQVKPCLDVALSLRIRSYAGPYFVADARSVHAAGGAPGQELGFALSAGVALLRGLESVGVPLDAARGMIGFRLAADADEFVALSKFRALRLAWARIEEACGLMPRKAHVQAESAWRDDDGARPLCEHHAWDDRRLLRRPQRPRQRLASCRIRSPSACRTASRGGSRVTASWCFCANPISASSPIRRRGPAGSRP